MSAAFSFDVGVESITFALAAFICVGGAVGVVMSRNPVHSALSLVATLFGVAVLFIAQEAYFLAAIQVIVYAGAIVVLFLFVIMLLGVDRVETFVREREPIGLATGVGLGIAISALAAVPLVLGDSDRVTGARAVTGSLEGDELQRLGRSIFTDYVFAFELTSALLVIAVIGAVVLSRRSPGEPIDLDEFPTAAEPEAGLDLGFPEDDERDGSGGPVAAEAEG